MKKILYIISILNILFFLISSFWLFSYDNQFRIMDGKAEIQIEKPKDMTNQAFVEMLKKMAAALNSDIAYTTFDLNDGKYVENVYVTRHDAGFLNLQYEKGNYEKDDFSTDLSLEKKLLHGSNYIGDYSIYHIEEMEFLSLDQNSYFVSDDRLLDWETALQEEGVQERVLRRNIDPSFFYVSQVQKVNLVKGILTVCQFLSLLFYFFMEKKEIAIKKLNGKNLKEVLFEEFFSNKLICIPGLMASFVAVALCTVAVMWNTATSVLFLSFIKRGLLFLFGGFVLFSICSVTYIMSIAGIRDIQGRDQRNKLYIIFAFAKAMILLVLVFHTSGFAQDLADLGNLNRSNLEVNQKIEDYVYVHLYSTIYELYDEYGRTSHKGREVANQRLKHFIEDTVDTFEGVIVYNGNYRLKGDLDDQEFRDITVNENYLKINPIKGADGKLITEEALDADRPNLIMSENENTKREVEDFVEEFNEFEEADGSQYRITAEDVNVIYYSADSKFYGLNPFTNAKYVGLLQEPILQIYNDNYSVFNALEIISNGAYLMKCDTDDPYMEILPYLKKNKLDRYILEAPHIKNAFSDQISATSRTVAVNTALIILYLIPLVFLTIYFVKIYICNYSKENFIKTVNGCGFWKNYHKAIVIEFLQLLLVASLMIYNGLALHILIFTASVDLAAFYFSGRIYGKHNINEILKGRR